MKVRIPLMIQDPTTTRHHKLEKAVEGFDPDREEYFLDGPVTRRIAVLDFSPETGELVTGATFTPPPPRRVRGWFANTAGVDLYEVGGEDMYTPNFIQVSVFATVLRTMYLFEKWETLGRPLTWAFASPQLLVVPRAGQMANAYYHRDSNSLQFFAFTSPRDPAKTVYTSLSRDIVAHETGHAIVDGIAPDLLDACTPQSLALHEAMADLTALLMAFDSHTLRRIILEETGGSLKDSTDFSSIAEEFGIELQRQGRSLRNLKNEKNLDPQSVNCVRRYEPHALSEVLSGALYNVMQHIHDDLKAEYAQLPEYSSREVPLFSASGEALRKGAERFKRMIFRALDYLPPGEISFADYGRALIAVDYVAYPDDERMRNWVRSEFVRRHIVQDPTALDAQTNVDYAALAAVDIPTLQTSDWYAYEFANANRPLLCIPPTIPFEIRPRLEVRKKRAARDPEDSEESHECILKVAWDHVEPNPLSSRYPQERRITVGTTLALDWDTGQILAHLTSAPQIADRPVNIYQMAAQRAIVTDEYTQQRQDRDQFLQRLDRLGLLAVRRHTVEPTGQPLLSTVEAEIFDDVMRVQGTGKLLHIMSLEAE